MQIKRLQFLIVILLANALSLEAFATSIDDKRNLAMLDNYNQRAALFQKYCLSKTPELYNLCAFTGQNDPSKTSSDCLPEFEKICEKELVDLKTSDEVLKEYYPDIIVPGKSSECHYQSSIDNKVLRELSDTSLSAADKVACENKESWGECTKNAACNVARGVMQIAPGGKLAQKIFEAGRTDKSQQSCLGSDNKGDCLTSLVVGILKDLWGNIEGVWDIAVAGAKWAKDSVISTWNNFTSIEDETSKKMLLASQQEKSWIDKFKAHPWDTITESARNIADAMSKSIKDTFMCAKWEGEAYVSKCVEPHTDAWDCATCGQKLNSICGVAGFMVGEIGVAALTGGTFNIVKAANKGVGIARVAAKVTESLPRLRKITDAVKSTRLISETVKVVRPYQRQSIDALTNAFKKKNHSPPSKATMLALASGKIFLKPITGYLKLLDKATELGMRTGDKIVERVASKTAISAGAITTKVTGKAGEVVAPETQASSVATKVEEVAPVPSAYSKEGVLIVEKMQQKIDRSIEAFVAQKDLTFITYPASESGLLWLSRGVATTKASDIKLKSIKGDSIFAGMISEKNNSINKARFSDKKYEEEIKQNLKSEKYILAPLTYDGKTAVQKLNKETGKLEELWIPNSDLKNLHPDITVPQVLVDKKTNKYVVSDLDGLLVADKSLDTNWSQNFNHPKMGPGQSKEHAKIIDKFNKNFSKETGMSAESVPLFRHSFTHSWDQVEDISFPLAAYSKNKKVVIEDLPQLWTYLQKQSKEGFKIRANCSWAIPLDLEMRKSIQEFRSHCP